MKRLLIFVFICMLSQCGSNSTQIIVHETQYLYDEIPKSEILFKDFQTAIKNMDLEVAESFAQSDYEIEFCKALQMIKSGNTDRAGVVLENIFAATDDSLLKNQIFTVLNEVWFTESEWDKVIRIHGNLDTDIQENETLIIAQHCSQKASEKYLFPDKPMNLPLNKSLSGSPVISVKVNGVIKNFWVDTHAFLSVLSSDIAEECNIQFNKNEVAKAGTATSHKVDFFPAVADKIEIGELTIENHPVIIIPKKNMEFRVFGMRIIKIDGIIGWNAIRNMYLEIDYNKEVLTIRKPFDQKNKERNLYYLEGPIVEFKTAEGLSLNFGLDTGANCTNAFNNILSKIDTVGFKKGHSFVGGAGGKEKIKTRIIPEIQLILNDISIDYTNLRINPSSNETFLYRDGLLGIDILNNRSMIIDASNGVCRLTDIY